MRLRTEGHKRSVRWMVAQVLERIALAEVVDSGIEKLQMH
jgi:hypothetical protein